MSILRLFFKRLLPTHLDHSTCVSNPENECGRSPKAYKNVNAPTNDFNIMIDVFISHSSQDVEVATALITLLRGAVNVLPDSIRCTSVEGYRLPAGAWTDDHLRVELRESKLFIALVTEASLQSRYVLFELGARWGANLHMIPLLAAGATPQMLPGPIKNINVLSCDVPTQLHQLVSDISRILELKLESPAIYQKCVDELVEISKNIRRKDTVMFEQEKTSRFWKIFFRNYVPGEKVYVVFSAKDKGSDFVNLEPKPYRGHTVKLSYNEVFPFINLQKEVFPIPVRDNIEVIHGGIKYKREIDGKTETIIEHAPLDNYGGKLIIIGSSHANLVCNEILKNLKLPYTFKANESDEPHYKYIFSEKKSYPDKYEESERLDQQYGIIHKDHGIILRIRNPYDKDGKNKILVLGGNHGHGTQAAIQTLSNPTDLNDIHQIVGENDFEALFEADIFGGHKAKFRLCRISVFVDNTWSEIYPKDKDHEQTDAKQN